jgi:hypothetical protein
MGRKVSESGAFVMEGSRRISGGRAGASGKTTKTQQAVLKDREPFSKCAKKCSTSPLVKKNERSE